MYKSWTMSAGDAVTLERGLDAFLNEYVEDLVSVSYSVTDRHHVLVVYHPLDLEGSVGEETAVAVAEDIIEQVEQ